MSNFIDLISSLIFSSNGVSDVPIDDEVLNSYDNLSYNEILKHHRSYSTLLKKYVENSSINLLIKIAFKVIFFIFALYVWYSMVELFKISFEFSFNLLNPDSDLDFIKVSISLLGTILPSLISLITSFVVIPEIIARYLFDTGEENSLIEIIKSLQTYDHNLYQDKIKSELHAHNDVESEIRDDNNLNDEIDSEQNMTENQNCENTCDNNDNEGVRA